MPRSKSLDILRALAVLLVMGRHVGGKLNSFPAAWTTGGWVGVDLFFVLSGFLVSGLLFKEQAEHGRLSIKNFLIRRGFKIYPAFWLMLFVSAILFFVVQKTLKPSAIVSEFLFVQNYGPAIWNHTWSLAVEEHFYLFLIALIFALQKICGGQKPFRLVPVIFGALALGCLLLRLLTWWASPGFDAKAQFYPTHLRMDSLFCGVLLAYLHHQDAARFANFARRLRWVLLTAGVALLAPAFCFELTTTPFIYTAGFTQFYLGSACLLAGMLGMEIPANFLTQAAACIGSHSYSIYLWHMPVLWWAMPLAARALKIQSDFTYATVYFLSATVCGIALAALVEFPILRLRDQLFPSRARPLAVT
jgi:peptidoglycan/LPS O-acetylase OafA/YrhL